jgi:predicted trehalose synthase
MLDGSLRTSLEHRYWPGFLARQSWFDHRAAPLTRVTMTDWGTLQKGDEPVFVALLTATFADGVDVRYVVPFAVVGGERATTIAREFPELVIVTIGGARSGVMHTRLDGMLGAAVADAMLGRSPVSLRHGRLVPTTIGSDLPRRVDDIPTAPLDTTTLRSHAIFGERVTLETVWRAWPGPSPEIEMLTLLASRTPFNRAPTALATLDYVDANGVATPAAHLLTYLPHQANAWRHTLEDLSRFFDAVMTTEPPTGQAGPLASSWNESLPDEAEAALGSFGRLAAMMGQRLGEMHAALATAGAPIEAPSADRLFERTLAAWSAAGPYLESSGPGDVRISSALEASRAGAPRPVPAIRVHGALDLAHVLIYEGDVSFIGPAEDPAVPPDQRRVPDTPLVDVASLLWSLQNVAIRALAVRPATSPTDHERLAAWARWWVAGASRALVAAHRQATAGLGIIPDTPDGVTAILRLALFEQAFRDISRTAVASAEWLHAPKAALALIQ